MKLYKVVDNEFNRKNYPDLIGQIPSSPPRVCKRGGNRNSDEVFRHGLQLRS